MNKWWLVVRFEFWRHILRQGFWWNVLFIPLLLVAIAVIVGFFIGGQREQPVGVVDLSGMLIPPTEYLPIEEDTPPIYPYASAEEAKTALLGEEIQAYFVVPADYLSSGQIEFIHAGNSYEGIVEDFSHYLRASLLAHQDNPLLKQLTSGQLDVVFHSLSEESNQGNPAAFFFPFLLGFIMVLGVFTTSGYLIQSVTDEKENRTMEILITSVTPEQLMMGKIVGLTLLGLIQITVWLAFAGMGVYFLVTRLDAPTEFLQLPLPLILIAIAWFIPFYLMISALITAIGISVTAASEAQQAVGILSMVSMFPMWLTFPLLADPNSPLAIFMSLLPFSALITLLVRWSLTPIPSWQLVMSWLLMAGTAVLATFLVGRVLRLGMLNYGQKLRWRELFPAKQS